MKDRKRSTRSRGKRKGQNRAAIYVIIFVVLFLFAVLLIDGIRLRRQIAANDKKTESLQSAISEEEARTAEIESSKEAMSTESFIREAAKEQLGLVDSDEVIFKAKN
jgi:cell division protein FtsB